MKTAKATVLSFVLGYILTIVAAYADPWKGATFDGVMDIMSRVKPPVSMTDEELEVVFREKMKRDKWKNHPRVVPQSFKYLVCIKENYFQKLDKMRLRSLKENWDLEKFGVESGKLALWIASNSCTNQFRAAVAAAKAIGHGPEMASMLIQQTYYFLYGAFDALDRGSAG